MVRLEHEPCITHVSHPHQLELTNVDHHQQTQTPNNREACSGCKLQPSGYMYSCRPCNFTLHLNCAQMPHLINHHSHPNHNLSLVPTSPYPEGLFSSDACNRRGSGFSYHCGLCDFDLHILCASKPLSLTHPSHLNHPLLLTFVPPYGTSKGFSCDVCRNVGSKQWLYRCNICEFDVHLDCATAVPRPPPQPLQHYHSFPTGLSGSTAANNQFQMQPIYGMHSASNGLVNAMLQGFVEGAAQQVGQTVVQSVIGGSGVGNSDFSSGIIGKTNWEA